MDSLSSAPQSAWASRLSAALPEWEPAFPASDNISVFNGNIRGMGSGIFLMGNATRVEKIHALGKVAAGIVVGSSGDSSVIGCTASGNGGDIFISGSGWTILLVELFNAA